MKNKIKDFCGEWGVPALAGIGIVGGLFALVVFLCCVFGGYEFSALFLRAWRVFKSIYYFTNFVGGDGSVVFAGRPNMFNAFDCSVMVTTKIGKYEVEIYDGIEELPRWLDDRVAVNCAACPAGGACGAELSCVGTIIKWLESEVEEDG